MPADRRKLRIKRGPKPQKWRENSFPRAAVHTSSLTKETGLVGSGIKPVTVDDQAVIAV